MICKVGWLVGFYGISTLVCYFMPNSLYIYILDIWDLQSWLFGFYGISILIGCLMPNPVNTYKVKSVKLVTLVEGDLKALFSIATTPMCGGGY